MGSSLKVQPANKLPQICLGRRVPVVLINKDSDTEYDQYVNVLVDSEAGKFMKMVQELLYSKL